MDIIRLAQDNYTINYIILEWRKTCDLGVSMNTKVQINLTSSCVFINARNIKGGAVAYRLAMACECPQTAASCISTEPLPISL